MHSLELKIPPVALGLCLGAAMWGSARLSPALDFALPGGRILAAGLAVVGLVAGLLGVFSFRRAKTTVNPLQPETASHLVVSGIYRWTRNPMYLGMLLVLLGWALFLANALALVFPAAFVLLMNRLQIRPEERVLASMFGAGFADYQSRVRRWL
jgi:protein-S-isoprenylcysteine O-methyltransferase Ste14